MVAKSLSLDQCNTLPELWEFTKSFSSKHTPQNGLRLIFGNGKLSRPRCMFVFINPTRSNHSSDPSWIGPSFPFLGIRPFWRMLNRAGLLSDALLFDIEREKQWSSRLASAVLDEITSQSLYLTNIVKWTGADASLPSASMVNAFLPVLLREIDIVKPDVIVTFGRIPFEYLVGQKIKLGEYYEVSIEKGACEPFALLNGVPVIPCYFPVGRGNPKRAVEMLRLLFGQRC